MKLLDRFIDKVNDILTTVDLAQPGTYENDGCVIAVSHIGKVTRVHITSKIAGLKLHKVDFRYQLHCEVHYDESWPIEQDQKTKGTVEAIIEDYRADHHGCPTIKMILVSSES